MQTLLSVPPALSKDFADLTQFDPRDVFATHDPPGAKLGSGGGTAQVLIDAWKASGTPAPLEGWLGADSRIILHAGGQSRRLPAYAAAGKALLPVPVFRWISGQRLDQTLMDLQLPLLRSLLEAAPKGMNTLVASGDVLVWNDTALPPVPDVDVVVLGLWDSPEVASHHGVFFTPRGEAERLEFMRQKPSPSEIQELAADHLFLLDVGIWLFSDRAIDVLLRKCGWEAGSQAFAEGLPREFDLYSTFGEALGRNPTQPDPEISALRCAVMPLAQGEFYHFGTSADLVRSSLSLQNRVNDQRRIRSPLPKPHPAIFIQNADTACSLGPENHDIWIENACIGAGWTVSRHHVLTGIPRNDWELSLPEGICLDVVPVGDEAWVLRPYGFSDAFRGALDADSTHWLGAPFQDWFRKRGLPPPEAEDIQFAALFPVCKGDELSQGFVEWMIAAEPGEQPAYAEQYSCSERLSAEGLGNRANLLRQFAQRKEGLTNSLPALARHAARSVFHQIDLHHAAGLYAASGAPLVDGMPDRDTQLFPYIHDRMFRSRVRTQRGENGDADEAAAFQALRESLIDPMRQQVARPRNTALADQVIWARSPVRLDLAGGWTDTPPYCLLHGGSVVNLAVELNGQPPIQVFARVSEEPCITLRSIDLGITTVLERYEDVAAYADVGSGFSIPRAALALAGFHPDFQASGAHDSLRKQLQAFGGGIELSLLCAIPKGSGLGTSSNLAATVLGALSELGGLGWDPMEIGNRALVLEQMLTSGGGWQDQFGGITRGVKLLQTRPGLNQTPELRWLPDYLFRDPVYKSNFLLYYTGITRVAKGVLAEIVRGMFLNRRETLQTLERLGHHAHDVFETLQGGSYEQLGAQVRKTWALNCELDPGTCPPEIQAIIAPLADWVHGLKLLGAGGGGYLLMLAKDAEAAGRIRKQLTENPPNSRARFVDFSLSNTGLQITRS